MRNIKNKSKKTSQTVFHRDVFTPNRLISAYYALPVNAKHLLTLAVSTIHSKNGALINSKSKIITAQDFGDKLGISNKHRYEELKKAHEQLWDFYYSVDTGISNANGEVVIKKYRVVNEISYSKGAVKFKFTSAFLKCIEDISGGYSKIKALESLKLKNNVAIRLHEHFTRFMNKSLQGFYRVSIDDLKRMLLIKEGDHYYCNKYFNKRLIEPAVNDIVKTLGWNVKVFKERTNRSITHLLFKFNDPSLGKHGDINYNECEQVKAARARAELRAINSKVRHLKERGI